MEILYEKYKIKVGEWSYDLYMIRPPKQVHKNRFFGEEVEVCLGYFTKLENCVQKIIHMEMVDRDEKVDLRDFIELYKDISGEVMSTINGKHESEKEIS